MADNVAVIDCFGTAVLVGHDWDGALVQATYLLAPGKVRGIASLSTSSVPYGSVRPPELAAALAGDGFCYQHYSGNPEWPTRHSKATWRERSGASTGTVRRCTEAAARCTPA